MSNLYDLPEWTDTQATVLDLFFENLQEINIYVEDAGSEIFYGELFDDLLDKNIKIKKIFPLNGRENVINYCKEYTNEKAAIFIIDADLYWVRGEEPENIPRLYQHDRYCIENYLFSKDAIVELIFETLANKTKEEIEDSLQWDSVIENIKDSLIKLFIEFATINKFDKSIKTVKIGIEDCFLSPKNSDWRICPEKVELMINSKKLEVLKKNLLTNYTKNVKLYNDIKKSVETNVITISDCIHIVSGKHFLIHILFRLFKEQTNNAFIKMNSFQLRLIRHCDKSTLLPLKVAIENTVNGIDYVR